MELPPSQWGQLSQKSSQTGTRLLLPGDNLAKLEQTTCLTKTASPTSHETNQTTLWVGLLNYARLCPRPQFFCLLKPIARVCTWRWLKVSWVPSLRPPTLCPESRNKPPFSAFTRPLYSVFRGGWSDLAWGLSGVWVLGPKLWFQNKDGVHFFPTWPGPPLRSPQCLPLTFNKLYYNFVSCLISSLTECKSLESSNRSLQRITHG
jgi:hypothetical protein